MRPMSWRIHIAEHVGITAPFENVSERNNTLHMFNANDVTRDNIPDEVSELLFPGTHFDRQPHTHHITQLIFLLRCCPNCITSKCELLKITQTISKNIKMNHMWQVSCFKQISFLKLDFRASVTLNPFLRSLTLIQVMRLASWDE